MNIEILTELVDNPERYPNKLENKFEIEGFLISEIEIIRTSLEQWKYVS
jgi:hypothetical protein